jgi:hypothetical protein
MILKLYLKNSDFKNIKIYKVNHFLPPQQQAQQQKNKNI